MVKKTQPQQQEILDDCKPLSFIDGEAEVKVSKNTLLLHSCCGPCSTTCIERLVGTYKITVFFYNPNITEKDEYDRRKEAQIKFIELYNKKGLEAEPEGGARCTECFRLRLERTAQAALRTGNTIFGTTLTVSPHKNYSLVSAIGCELANKYHVEFLDIDFKKKAGFQRSIQMSKEYELYRQNYCGCEFSKIKK